MHFKCYEHKCTPFTERHPLIISVHALHFFSSMTLTQIIYINYSEWYIHKMLISFLCFILERDGLLIPGLVTYPSPQHSPFLHCLALLQLSFTIPSLLQWRSAPLFRWSGSPSPTGSTASVPLPPPFALSRTGSMPKPLLLGHPGAAWCQNPMRRCLVKAWSSWRMKDFMLIRTAWCTRVGLVSLLLSPWPPSPTPSASQCQEVCTAEVRCGLSVHTQLRHFKATWRTACISLEVLYTPIPTAAPRSAWAFVCRPPPRRRFPTCSWGTGIRSLGLPAEDRLWEPPSAKTQLPLRCLWRVRNPDPAPVLNP